VLKFDLKEALAHPENVNVMTALEEIKRLHYMLYPSQGEQVVMAARLREMTEVAEKLAQGARNIRTLHFMIDTLHGQYCGRCRHTYPCLEIQALE
jgi:hypothetical protein